jgi:hypothetical protein
MWTEFEFPLPPRWPAAIGQIVLPFACVMIRFWLTLRFTRGPRRF